MSNIDDKAGEAAREYAERESAVFNHKSTRAISSIQSKAGFIAGVKWALSLPLAERLTEEERKKIKDIYWAALKEWIGVGDAREHCRAGFALENIFGIEMFKNK